MERARFALDAGQVFFDLRELILERGCFAQQAQDHLAAGFDGLLALAHLGLQSFALLVDFQHAPRAWAISRFERVHGLLLRGDLAFERGQPLAQLLRFVLGLRDALLRWRRFPSPAMPAGRACARLPRSVRQLLARFGELLFDLVAGQLPLLVRLFLVGHLLGQRLAVPPAARFSSMAVLRGIALQQAVFAREHDAQARFQFRS